MRHYPIFINLEGRRVVVSGAGETAVAKLRLLMKTEAHITVVGEDAVSQVRQWAAEGRVTLIERPMEPGDALCASLFYAANDDADEDKRVASIAHAEGALVNIVDNLEDSQFITPAIVDRDPVTIAIGTEGAAPVLARKIKADLEERLPASLGTLARLAQAFRGRAEMLPAGRKRRDFWSKYFYGAGERAYKSGGERAVQAKLEELLIDTMEKRRRDGEVAFVGAGPGDPDLLTMKARRMLHEADVVLHDQLVPASILELARREALIIETGKKGFGKSWSQDDINALMVKHAKKGAQIVRLKSGDPSVFGRLDEETAALNQAGIAYSVVPGITAASAAAANIGQSLTRRGRNSSLRLLTGHDTAGFAAQDWQALAADDAVAAIYMGKKAAGHMRKALLQAGASSSKPVTIVFNASRPDQKIIHTNLGSLADAIARADNDSAAVILYGIGTKAAEKTVSNIVQEFAA